ncbi:ABC transporter substrate-binding protein [Euzebya pacifica]|uniref:ABC transporter substrate-binding protein n=1 Tax=Euzebya pacifica TaxID=1608957 RepID=UPI0030F82FE7
MFHLTFVRARAALLLVVVLLFASACGAADDAAPVDASEVTASDDGAAEVDDGASAAPDPDSDAPAPEETGGEDAAAGGSLTIGLGSLTTEFNPFKANSAPRSYLTNPLFSRLTQLDTTVAPPALGPGIAASWERTDDLTWRFSLVPDLVFPNGEPIDATAVVASIEYGTDPTSQSFIAGALGAIESATAVDPLTVDVGMSVPVAGMPELLSSMPIVPPAYFAEVGEDFFQQPIGSGPWVLAEHVPGERIVFEPNPDAIGGAPLLDRVTFVAIPEDAARVAALRAGDVDVINKVPTDSLAGVEGNGDVLYSHLESGAYVVDLFTTEGPLADPLVRQALNMAIDREALNDAIMGGEGRPAQGQLPTPSDAGFCDGVEPFPYDPDGAAALLAEAGVSDVELTFQTSQGFLQNDRLLSQAIAEQLQQVDGITSVTLDTMEFSAYLEVFNGQAERADLFAWRPTSTPTLDAMVQLGRTTSDFPTHNLGFSDADYDATFDAAQAADPGSAERQALICEMTEQMREQAPWLYVMQLPDTWAHDEAVTGFAVDAGGNPLLDQIGLAG